MTVDEMTSASVDAVEVVPGRDDSAARRITLARLRGRVTWWCVAAAGLAAVGYAFGTVVAGRLAVHPTGARVALLALAIVGGAVLDTAGRAGWAAVVDRAEGQ